MTQDLKGGFQGLVTNIAETQAPGSALRKADNVVVRAPGALEPRQGFPLATIDYATSGLSFYDSAVHGTDTIYFDGTYWRSTASLQRTLDTYTSTSTFAPAKLRADASGTVAIRGNHYLPHAKGVAVAQAATDSVWTAAGLDTTAVYISGTVPSSLYGSNLPNNSRWGYRIVMRRKFPNGLILRSRPSGAVIVDNATGASAGVLLVVGYQLRSPFTSVESVIELYRTRTFSTSTTPDDEMQLVQEYHLIGTSSGTVNLTDNVADTARGTTLYTSPSRGGIQNANDRPPACAFVETYKGAVFYGNIVGPQRFTVSFSYDTRTGSATGVGVRAATGDATAGNVALLNVTPTTGLKVGMHAIISGISIPTRRIVSIVGTTVTLSVAPSSTAVGVTIAFTDSIEIDGMWIPLYKFGSTTGSLSFPSMLAGVQNTTLGATVAKFVTYAVTPPIAGNTDTWVIESVDRNAPTFTIRATNGASYSPALAEAGGTASTSTMDTYQNGLIYSSTDEPEHVPPKNFLLVGDKSKAIIGLKSTRDAMFIFKEDGIFRLSGVNGQWRIDPFDLTTFCVLPSSIRRMNNRIYMLSNKGVVRISDGAGVEVLSHPISNVVRGLIDDIRANFLSLGYYKFSGLTGCASYVDDRNSEYALLVGSNNLECGGDMLVYNELSNAWTTFSFNPSSATNGFTPLGLGVDARGVPGVLCLNGVRKASYATTAVGGETSPETHDGSTAVTVTGVLPEADGQTATLLYTPASAFDANYEFHIGSSVYRALGSGAGSILVDTSWSGVTPITGAATVYAAVRATVQPHGFVSPGITGKFRTHVDMGFSKLLGASGVSVTYSSAEVVDEEADQLTDSDSIAIPETRRTFGQTRYHLGTLLRALIPRAHARSWLLRTTVQWTQAMGKSVLEFVATESREQQPGRPQRNSTGVG